MAGRRDKIKTLVIKEKKKLKPVNWKKELGII